MGNRGGKYKMSNSTLVGEAVVHKVTGDKGVIREGGFGIKAHGVNDKGERWHEPISRSPEEFFKEWRLDVPENYYFLSLNGKPLARGKEGFIHSKIDKLKNVKNRPSQILEVQKVEYKTKDTERQEGYRVIVVPSYTEEIREK